MELLGRYAYRKEFRPLLLAYLGAAPGHRVLDVGAGSGYLGRMIAGSFTDSDVTCLDADPAMLAVARRLVESEGLTQRVAVVEGDAYTLPFEDASFDLVTSHLLLCILSDPGRALREQVRVTRPGGTVSCVVCFCHADRLPQYHGRSNLPGDHRIDELLQALAHAWRIGVRPRLLEVDHGILNQDIAWHFRDAGLSDVNVNGHLAVVAPGDDRIPPEEGFDFAAAVHEAELARLRVQRRDHATELVAAGFPTEDFDELLRLKEARLARLRERPDSVRDTMEVRCEALLLVRGRVPGPRLADRRP